MTDEKLLQFVSEFRDGVLNGARSSEMCFAICAPLVTLLEMHGVDGMLCESTVDDMNHFWIRLKDGRVLDPTGDQFNGTSGLNLPPVYLGAPTQIHYPCKPAYASKAAM